MCTLSHLGSNSLNYPHKPFTFSPLDLFFCVVVLFHGFLFDFVFATGTICFANIQSDRHTDDSECYYNMFIENLFDSVVCQAQRERERLRETL